jgi:hypothetical protein
MYGTGRCWLKCVLSHALSPGVDTSFPLLCRDAAEWKHQTNFRAVEQLDTSVLVMTRKAFNSRSRVTGTSLDFTPHRTLDKASESRVLTGFAYSWMLCIQESTHVKRA